MPPVSRKSERSLWNVPGCWNHRDDRVSGPDQYVGGYGTSPNQGFDPALSQLWRVFSSIEYDLYRDPDEYYSPESGGKGVRILIVGGGTGGHLFPCHCSGRSFCK